MKKVWLVKILALDIVILFISIIFQPGISAIDKETDYYDELKASNEIKITGVYEETITFIKGYAVINWIERKGLFRGEVNLTQENYTRSLIYLSGFRRSEIGIEYYNVSVVDGFVFANHFIGLNKPSIFLDHCPVVLGIAFGNIEWN